MKKLLTLMLVMLLAFSIIASMASCKKDDDASNGDGTSDTGNSETPDEGNGNEDSGNNEDEIPDVSDNPFDTPLIPLEPSNK